MTNRRAIEAGIKHLAWSLQRPPSAAVLAALRRPLDVELDLIEAEIARRVQPTNLQWPEAAAAVASLSGEDISDMVPARPLSDEDRERLGLKEPYTPMLGSPE